jgi:CubicO group peptidase (beta-lactamase class C family)
MFERVDMRASDPEAAGFDPARLERVAQLFRAQQERGLFPGGQLAVRRGGHLALDVAVGIARGFRPSEGEPPTPYTTETRSLLYSATKGLTATAIALLEAQGKLDIDAPVAKLFPEFAAHGKGEITTADLLTQRAGLMMSDFSRRPNDWADGNKVIGALVAEKPAYPRGTLAYSPFGHGWVLGEVVRRASGKPLPEFLSEHLLEPAGLGSLRFGATPEERTGLARGYWLGTRPVVIAGVELGHNFEAFHNSDAFFSAMIPGAGAIGDAASLAGFYELLARGGETPEGRRLLPESVIRRYASRQVFGFDRSARLPVVVGLGFGLGWLLPHPYGRWNTGRCFGHVGAFCVVAYADPRSQMGVAIITNGNRGPNDLVSRFSALGSAIRRALKH